MSVLTGIDIGSDSIKFVQARKGAGGKLHVLNAGIASVSELQSMAEGDARDESIAAVLRGMLAERRARIRKAHTCVSGKKVITRYAHVPPMPVWRLDKVMAFEMQNEAPGGGEDVASDYKLLELPNKGTEFTVLVGMAKEDAIHSQNNVYKSVGIAVEDITLGCLPTLNSFLHSHKAELETMSGPCAVVNIGAEKMEVVILFGTKLYFARSLTPAGSSLTEAIREELRIPFANAEHIKRQRGHLSVSARGNAAAAPAAADQAATDPAPGAVPEGQPAADDAPVIPVEDVPVIPVGDMSKGQDDEDTALGQPDDEKMIPTLTPAPAAEGQPAAGDTNPITRVLDSAAHGVVNSIQSCLRYAKAQTKLPTLTVNRIYITGGSAALPGLAPRIQERLGIETLVFDPLENVDYSAMDPAGREMLEANRHAFVTALGLVEAGFNDSAVEMSLLPKSQKERRLFMKTGVFGYAAAVLFVVAVIIMLASSQYATRKLKAFTQEQKVKIDKAKQSETEIGKLKGVNADLAEKVGRLKEIVGESRTHLAAVALLKRLIPNEVEIQSLRNYSEGTPPPPKSSIGTKNRYGRAQEVNKQTRILFISGKVSEKVSPDRSREIVRKFVEDAVKAEGPFGKKVFASPKVLRHIAEVEKKRVFDIQLELIEEN